MQKNPDVPAHDNSRSFLSDVVQAQQEELTKLGKEVATSAAWLAQLIEAEKRARVYRDEMKEEVAAVRSEQQQIQMSVTSVHAAVEKISKTLADHEAERQQRAGAFKLATASARIAWGIVGGVVLAITAGVLAVWRVVSNLPGLPTPPPGGHP